MTRIHTLYKSLLPGIFLFGFTVGTGSVTAMAKAGADYGMSLLWTVFLSCAITFFLIHLFGKYALVSGQTALQSFRKYIHPAVGYFFIVTLTAHVCGSVIGVMGILADVCHTWSKNLVEGGISPLNFAILFIVVVYLIFLTGKTETFQNILAFFVGIMSICFLINFFILMPAASDVAMGMLPNLPSIGTNESAFLVIASMVGTTVFSGLFILRTTLVKEAGWTIKDLKAQKRDALFAGLMMFVVSGSIMAAAAGTLHTKGIRLENVTEMITLLEPLAGSFAVAIFTIGIVAAGVSSQFPNVALLPLLLDDYYERKPNMKRPAYRVIAALISLLGLLVPVLKAKPIVVMIVSQAFGALVLPATVACIIFLGNRESIMGKYRFSYWINILLGLILIFALIMSYMSYSSIIAILGTI
jgi:manganese transport protein